jgi:catechol 2,3-dioxygenase-like lactoylglutathione lyase family enzyme
MLGDSVALDVALLATDLDVARDFYSNKLGLALIDGSGRRLTFSCGDDSTDIISNSS